MLHPKLLGHPTTKGFYIMLLRKGHIEQIVGWSDTCAALGFGLEVEVLQEGKDTEPEIVEISISNGDDQENPAVVPPWFMESLGTLAPAERRSKAKRSKPADVDG